MIMNTKLTYARTMLFIGRLAKNKKITGIPNVLCYRKRMPIKQAKIARRGFKESIGLVSSIGLPRSKNAKLCKFWCHCFKNPEFYIKDIPGMLLSESDFVDPKFIKIFSRSRKPSWDFFYFTSGGYHAHRFKGSGVMGKTLKILCGEFKLRGIIIQYMKSDRPFVKQERRQIKKYANLLRIKRGRLTPRTVAKFMSKSRFGFFPNTRDCSPLIISESLLRDCPVLMNQNILGGWKYVNDETGYLFNPKNMNNFGNSVECILSGSFHPKNEYMTKYGYINTAKRFAKVAKQHIKGFRGYDMIGFQGTQDKMRILSK